MSLKAYDGMMTKENLLYFHENLKENLPKFKKASEKHLAKAFAECFLMYTDEGKSLAMLKSSMEFKAINSVNDKRGLEEIKIDNSTTILSYLFQCAKVLSKSDYKNDFTSHLCIAFEPIKDKILVYPNICVEEHRQILLSFLTDWYAQNQCDADEKVSKKEWKQRCKDWYGFNETKGLQIEIILFDPKHYWNNLFNDFRGEELINAILTEIPSNQTRKQAIWKKKFLSQLMEKNKDAGSSASYFNSLDFMRSPQGQVELKEFQKNNPIKLTKIDQKFIAEAKFESLP
jgi:hypothetical protein